LQVGQGEPGVHDVFDDHDIPPFDRRVQILQQANLSRAGHARSVAGHRDEVDRGVAANRARQVRHEHVGALQHADEMHARWMIPPDVRRHFLHTRGDRIGCDERLHD